MKRALPLLVLAAVVLGALVFLVLRLRGGAPVGSPSARPRDEEAEVVDRRRAADAGPRATAIEPPDRSPADAGGATISPVVPITVVKTRIAMRPIVRRCAGEHAAELSPRARLTARALTVIAGGRLTLGAVELDARGLPSDGQLVACVRRGLEGFTLPLPGHADVARHPMRFPFDLPLP